MTSMTSEEFENGENVLSEADIAFIKNKLAEPKIFVNGRRKFKEEVRLPIGLDGPLFSFFSRSNGFAGPPRD